MGGGIIASMHSGCSPGRCPSRHAPRRVTRRPPRYREAMIRVLAQVGEAAGDLCSQRVQAALPQWLPWLRPRLSLTAELERQLRAISPRQIARRLQPRKRTLTRRLYGTTQPGALLEHQIPSQRTPGMCPSRAIWTLIGYRTPGPPPAESFSIPWTAWDSQTGWVERQAVRGKGHHGVV